MKKLLCVVLVFACLLCFGGCAEEEYVEPEGVLLTVRSGDESTPAYARLSWSDTWSETERRFVHSGVGGSVEDLLDDLVEYPHFITPITYYDGVTFEPREDVTVGYIDVYKLDGDDTTVLHGNSSHDVLDTLEADEYYVVVNVVVWGKYIKEADGYESSGYHCIFKLIVE